MLQANIKSLSFHFHYLLLSIFLLIVLSTNSFATIYEYSLNKRDGLVVFEVYRVEGKKKIRMFSKSPYASKLQKLHFLNNIFISGNNNFSGDEEKTIIYRAGFEDKIIANVYSDQRWEISYDELYSRIKYFNKGDIKSRHLMAPNLPVLDIAEMFFLPTLVGESSKYEFYLLDGNKSLRMSLMDAKYQIIWLICLIGNKVIQMIKTNSLKPIHQP